MPDVFSVLDRFRLSTWDVDPHASELRDRATGAVQRLEPKVMAVLVRVAEEAGQPVAREALMASVWPQVVVSEDALNRAVSKLRRALGDDPVQPRHVETIPTVGYRLVAPVERVALSTEAVEAVPLDSAPGRHWRWAVRGSIGVAIVMLGVLIGLRLEADRVPAVHLLTRSTRYNEIHPDFDPTGEKLAYASQRAKPDERDSVGRNVYDTAMMYNGTSVDLTGYRPGRFAPRWRYKSPLADDLHPTWGRPEGPMWVLRCAEPLTCVVRILSSDYGRVGAVEVGPWGLAATAEEAIAVRRDSLTGPYRLVAIGTEGKAPRVLTNPPAGAIGDLFPEVSLDGKRLAFVRRDARGEDDLFVTDLQGSPPQRVTHDGRAILGHTWAEDGRSLIYVANRDGVEALWRVNVRRGEPERIPVVVAGRFRSPTAAAGKLVLAVEQLEVGLHSWAGHTWERVVPSTALDTDPALAADGRLAFVSTRSGAPELYVADGEDLRQVTTFEGPAVGAPRWHPAGEWLAFEAQTETLGSIYVVDGEGGEPKALTDGAGYDTSPRWGPDGDYVYFASTRRGPGDTGRASRWALWRVPVWGGKPERVGPPWSYTGEAVTGAAVVYMRSGEPGLWYRQWRDSAEEQLLDDLAREDWDNWTVVDRDTDPAIIYPRRIEAGVEIRRLRLADRSDVVLTTLPRLPGRIQALAVSPDGERLVAAQTTRDESDLVLLEPFK
ncbi:MAG: winged helix-turn-helix domain-containing protein [Bacteroidota bacterium]